MHNRTIADLARALRNKECSSTELTRHFLGRIGQLDGRVDRKSVV